MSDSRQVQTRNVALSMRDVRMQFPTSGKPVLAVDNISLDVFNEEFLSIIGPSGCGKSTLFGIIGGLVDGWSGSVSIDGIPTRRSHKGVGMVFQEESTFPWRTARENVEFPLELRGVPQAERRRRAEHFLDLVGLSEFAERYPSELSGGMRQRTALARTLAFEPRILLMDEPFAALDEQTRLLLGDKVLQIHRELKQTTLLITHSITEAVQLSDRVAVMSFRPGRIKTVIDIDLPRPRTSEIVGHQSFGHYVGLIWNELREEADKGLPDSKK